MAAVAWVNGRVVGAEEPAVSVTDRGFLYGEGVFETMRAYGGRVFRLGQHLARLAEGAQELGLTAPAKGELEAAVAAALAASQLPEAGVRVSLTPETLVVLVRPLALPPQEQYECGCAALSHPAALLADSPLRRVKSLNYLDKLLAQRQAEQAGAQEAILVDPDGWVVEGARRNVFAVLNDALVTPPLSRGLLAGITRATVLEVAREQGLEREERDLHLTQLRQADECFLTSSLAELLPVATLDHTRFPAAPGAVTRDLTAAYRARVAAELAG